MFERRRETGLNIYLSPTRRSCNGASFIGNDEREESVKTAVSHEYLSYVPYNFILRSNIEFQFPT